MSDEKSLYPGVALVTGGGSGLGKAIARRLIDDGYDVVVTGRDSEKLETAVSELGEKCIGIQCDSSSEEDVENLRSKLNEQNLQVSVLINNAGIGGPGVPLTEVSATEWDEVFDVNVRGTFLVCKAFIPAMAKRGNGFVLNIASVTGKRPLINRTPYAASKMAVIGLTNTLAFEVGGSGVMVNTLSPGPIKSERMKNNFEREARLSGKTPLEVEYEFVSRSALGRMVALEEVANAASSLLRIPGLTGTDFDVSGGMIA